MKTRTLLPAALAEAPPLSTLNHGKGKASPMKRLIIACALALTAAGCTDAAPALTEAPSGETDTPSDTSSLVRALVTGYNPRTGETTFLGVYWISLEEEGGTAGPGVGRAK